MISIEQTVRGLIFDLDGTLADTMPLHWRAFHETFAAFGESCSQEWLDSLAGVPTVEMAPIFNRDFGAALDPLAFTEEKERRAFVWLAQAEPIEPLVALVHSFRGRLPLAVASSGVRANVQQILAAIGLQHAFDAVITSDDVSRGKPNPDIFLEAARRIGVAPQCCQVFEDTDAGLEAARRAGMRATDVRPLLAQAGNVKNGRSS